MAIIYDTTMHPTKLELLTEWLPTQSWFVDEVADIEPVAAYRFDDPEGEVGMEGHFLRVGGDRVYHVPLTYRGEPLEAGEAFLLGTSEHGVLGKRWIYDASGDPVYRAKLAQVISQAGCEAEETEVSANGATRDRRIHTRVRGSGTPGAPTPDLSESAVLQEVGVTTVTTKLVALGIRRVLNPVFVEPHGTLTLRATWPAQVTPVVIATLAIT